MGESRAIAVDVEDIADYFRFNPHPSGIQRVALDLIWALLAEAFERVVLLREGMRRVEPGALAAMVAAEREPEPVADVLDDRTLRARVQRRIRRLPPEMRDPLFRAAVLQSQVIRNARALMALVRPPAPVPIRAVPEGAAVAVEAGLFLSLGAPWSVRGAPARMAAMRARGARTALLLHDLIPLRRPEWFAPARVEAFREWLHATLPETDRVLTLSRYVADDLAAYAAEAGLAAPPTTVLTPGRSRLGEGLDAATAGLPVAGSYVLFVSTLEARKNHALAVQVWQRLMDEVRAGTRAAASVPQLVFAGRIGTGVADLLQQLDNSRWLGGRVRLIREPGDAEVRALYRGCLFSILPSLAEGWGLPLGESLAAGAPCVAASGTALPEAGGALCRYFDPEDVGDAHRAVAAMLDEPGAIAAARAAIAAGFDPPGWDVAARAVLELAP